MQIIQTKYYRNIFMEIIFGLCDEEMWMGSFESVYMRLVIKI